MPTPFPGMDPYLESRGLWEEIHTPLILEIASALDPVVQPIYRIAVERRRYLTVWEPEAPARKPGESIVSGGGTPSGAELAPASAGVRPLVGELPLPEEVTEHYLEIRDVIAGDIVTIIEILSPINKLTRRGREEYERKRLERLASAANLVEIDLVRAGEPFPFYVESNRGRSDYRIIVSRARRRPQADVYLFGLQEAIPDIPIPLRPAETEPVLHLNEILHNLYNRAGSDLEVDYEQPSDPPLSDEDARWAAELVRRAKS